MRMARRAPGLTRSFAMESWREMPRAAFESLREEARAAFDPSLVEGLSGGDLDASAVELARRHLHQAGLDGRVRFAVEAIKDCRLSAPEGVFLCNPPYGERLSDRRGCEALYREMGLLLRRHPGWTLCAITSHPGFERCVGRRADKRRRLYNGRLECEFMTFFPAGQRRAKG